MNRRQRQAVQNRWPDGRLTRRDDLFVGTIIGFLALVLGGMAYLAYDVWTLAGG